MSSSYRILITDDNSAIHEDIESILGQNQIGNQELDDLDSELFGNSEKDSKNDMSPIVSYTIEHAYSGEEAIKKVAAANAENNPYALLFMDVRMPPGMDGIVAVQKIWEKYPNTEIIICSAYSDYSWDSIIKIYGKTDKLMFLQKPFNRIAIQQMAISMTTKWELQNELRDLIQNLDAKVEKRTRELKIALEKTKQAQKETEKAAAAAAAQKVRSEFLSVMGHELRTPLNAILGFSDLLKPHFNDGKPAEYVAAIKSSGQSLITLLNDILDISKMENGQLEIEYEAASLKQIMNGIEEMYRPVASQKQLVFSLAFDEKTPDSLMLDSRRLRQILVNLVGNAVKFTKTGSIKLTTRCIIDEKRPKSVVISISVEDTGLGIPKNHLTRIFEAFTQQTYSDARSHEGVGLGLTIAKRLVTAMKGQISVSSKEGVGSKFTITLPDVLIAKNQPSSPVEPETQPAQKPAEATNWGDRFFSAQIQPHDRKRLQMLLDKLENPIMKKWESTFETMITTDIQRFGEVIQKIGTELRIEPLQIWGEQVAGYASSFQIEEMNETMARYPELVRRFSEAIQSNN
ncbi:MAG: hybrid sensor histidine kinase/response regulator [Calditrichia bacterium]